ncbi:MAG: tRNA threonylcarbamoyladenosine biosynthesis protein TsaE [Parasphingorhabdus sp.]|jgi:tRNA threonylcarbamoyladenosine biosynthesis protein TsaE
METYTIIGSQNMVELGREIAPRFQSGDMVWLDGDLGSGKTTLVQGVLAGLGYEGLVTSPTYTLLEPYSLENLQVVHMDLYRLKSAEELEMLGIRDFVDESLCLVEWPTKGAGLLPAWSWSISLAVLSANSRQVIVEQRQ